MIFSINFIYIWSKLRVVFGNDRSALAQFSLPQHELNCRRPKFSGAGSRKVRFLLFLSNLKPFGMSLYFIYLIVLNLRSIVYLYVGYYCVKLGG